ncbi:hypothetical protein GCM10023335_55710 [Streptomyces siamensis]|uniref:Uncharacterized protein n=1 Tax=Streptomyces siamensis TaxID=1274986 RepID=A0ABP9JAI2_9ACTN
MDLSTPVQPPGETVPRKDPNGVGGQEPGTCPRLHVCALGPLQDDAVDSPVQKDVAEYEAGRAGPEDDHIGRVGGPSRSSVSVCHGTRY